MSPRRRNVAPPNIPALGNAPVIAVCHPDWRGVRAAAYTFGVPVIESATLDVHAEQILAAATEARTHVLVIHGWPPGSVALTRRAAEAGIATRVVLHSSTAQHGAEEGEARVVDEVLQLLSNGHIGRVGVVKAGLAPALQALGHPVVHVPNRTPTVGQPEPIDLGEGELHLGVFGEAFWRKNIVTQLAAVALLPGARAHTLQPPDVGYLRELPVRAHGILPRERFLDLQASMDLNLYVTLSECHPLTPIESYLSGVPCLMSRTSEVFASDDLLWDFTTVDRADDPSAIAQAARRLLEHRDEAVRRAGDWIAEADDAAALAWDAFVSD